VPSRRRWRSHRLPCLPSQTRATSTPFRTFPAITDDEAVVEVFEAMERMEEILGKQRWLAGDGKRFTEADIRAFVTIVRFDAVYVVSAAAAPARTRRQAPCPRGRVLPGT